MRFLHPNRSVAWKGRPLHEKSPDSRRHHMRCGRWLLDLEPEADTTPRRTRPPPRRRLGRPPYRSLTPAGRYNRAVPLKLPTTVTTDELLESERLTPTWVDRLVQLYRNWHVYVLLFAALCCLWAFLFKPDQYDRGSMLIGLVASTGSASLLFAFERFQHRNKITKRVRRLNLNPGMATVDHNGISISYRTGGTRFIAWSDSDKVGVGRLALVLRHAKRRDVLPISSISPDDRTALVHILRQALPAEKLVERP